MKKKDRDKSEIGFSKARVKEIDEDKSERERSIEDFYRRRRACAYKEQDWS
jgi:hypothetical protein